MVQTDAGRECRLQINNSTVHSASLPDPDPAGGIRLKVEVDESANSVFSYAPAGDEFIKIERNFPAKEGGWIGAKVGLFCQSQDPGAHADFDYFRFA